MRENDKSIIALKADIENKRKNVGTKPTFSPKTKCMFTFNGVNYNINVLKQSELEVLHVQLNNLVESAKEFNYDLYIDSCLVTDLIDDVVSKLSVIKYNNGIKKFEQIENKLDSLMSEDIKTELALKELAEAIKSI